ncbi:facilitated trehalose transporter Tret1-like [Cylas formicarius]|uniref:facilitated trehalose transporter Tret1-like n=1 Tax=Cylas formicarius TaxID=197179 RepID=UPI002958C42C|nr:facilitated trehalose transporter Tret1-like [Cylas formicarius]
MQKGSNLYIYVTALSANLFTFGVGIGYGWSSPALPKLSGSVDPEQNPLPEPATVSEQSWMASLLSLGAMTSPIVTALLAEKIGRKKTLLIFSLPMVASHLIMVFANKVFHFYIARFLIGVSVGCMFTVIPVFAAEISQKHNRGVVGLILNVMMTCGHLMAAVVGPYVTISALSIISLVPIVAFLVIFGLFIPETPYFYALIDNKTEAERSLMRLRRTASVEQELTEIIKSVKELKLSQNRNFVELFTDRYHLKTLVWVIFVLFFQQFTGMIYIISYTQKIFDTANTPLSGDVEVMIFTAVQLVAVLFSTQTVDRIARKVLMIGSLVLMLLPNAAMAIYFNLLDSDYDVSVVSWIPVAALIVFISAYNLGIGPLGFVFEGEIFDPNVKAWGVTVGTCFKLLVQFLAAMFMPSLSQALGFFVPFWIFAGFTLIGIVFIRICIPETKGKSFLEIQHYVRNKK